jgi:capsular exopolysaccharide synthesis family protein
MGRTHEALLKAERELERKQGVIPKKAAIRDVPFVPTPLRMHNGDCIEWYRGLKNNLLALWKNSSKKTLMFAGIAPGDGVTTTGLNFAIVLAKDTKKKVLLIDTNVRTPAIHHLCRVDSSPGVTDLPSDLQKVIANIKKFGTGELFILPCGENRSDPISFFESHLFSQFMNSMRSQYDYIIIDTPAVSRFLESRVFCTLVDGVVLVIKYSKTRQQAAISVKKELEEAGANILGVVVNRMRFYIPEWLYRRL